MRKVLFLVSFVFSVFAFSASSYAASVSLQWGQVAAADGYNVYRFPAGEQAITTPPRIPIAKVGKVGLYNDTGLTAGAWSYFVTSYNGWGESPPSNIVSTPPLPTAPTSLILVVVVSPAP